MNKPDLVRYIGSTDQLASIRRVAYMEGYAAGKKAHIINNGLLSFTVLDDGCMDIGELWHKGTCINFLGKGGWHANSYDMDRNVMCGMFFTCGLRHVGALTNDAPLHGLARTEPAENIYALKQWKNNNLELSIHGDIREAELLGENLVLHRSIMTQYKGNAIVITDELENQGFIKEKVEILYHFNTGYPLLQKGSQLVIPSIKYVPRNENTVITAGDTNPFVMDEPADNRLEQVYFHTLSADENGETFSAVVNPAKDLAWKLTFNLKQLPYFTQWKCIRSGDYVMGMELSMCPLDEDPKSVFYLSPFEKLKTRIVVKIIDDYDEINEMIEFSDATEKA